MNKCIECNEELKNYKSKRCWKHYLLFNRGKNHPSYNTKHSLKTKKKLKLKALERCKNKEYLTRLQTLRIGTIPWNKNKKGIYSKATLKKMSKVRLGKSIPIEIREKISKSNTGKHAGKKNSMFGKVQHARKVKYKDTWMRSTWEYNFAFFLDLNKIKWKYEPETFNFGDITYTPDFYLSEFDIYIEIKGWLTDISKNKMDTFKNKRKDLSLIMFRQKDLLELGII